MQYISHASSPLGAILLAADSRGLTGLCFEGQKNSASWLAEAHEERELPIFTKARQWLELYFSGQEPTAALPLHFTGTAFQHAVWELLLSIPYGQTTTYGELARQLARRQGSGRMSAQAVGQAVSRNPIPIFIPCHRVIGANGALTGYVGGLDRKRKLLQLEGVEPAGFRHQ